MTYKITKLTSHGKWFTRNTPKMVVFHNDLGTYKRTKNTIFGSASVSYHFYIRRDVDEIIQYVPVDKGAWAQGILHKPIQAVKDLLFMEHPNRSAISIAYEGKPLDRTGKVNWNWNAVVTGELGTERQIELAVWLMKKFNITELPKFSHPELTSYKPKSATDFKNRVVKALKAEKKNMGECKVENFSRGELLTELIKRFKL